VDDSCASALGRRGTRRPSRARRAHSVGECQAPRARRAGCGWGDL